MTVTSLIYKINADATGFSREFAGAEKDVQRFSKRAKSNMAVVGQAFKVAGGLAVTAMAAMVKETVSTASEMSFVAERTGLAVEEVSQLAYAASLSDIEIGKLDGRLQRFNRQMGDAADGTGSTAEMMRRLNINLRDDSGMRSQVDILGDVADAVANAKDGYEETAIAAEFFGRRGGPELLPFLRQGKDGIEELREEADRLGVTIGTDTANAARQFEDDLTRLRTRGQGLAIAFGSDVIPVIGEYANILANSSSNQRELSDEISVTAKTAAFIMKAIEGVRATFVVLGQTVGAIAGTLVHWVTSSLKTIGILARGAGNVLKGVVKRDMSMIRGAVTDSMGELGDHGESMIEGLKAGWAGYSDDVIGTLTESAARMARIDAAARGEGDRAGPLRDRSDTPGPSPLSQAVSEAEKEYQRLVSLTKSAQQNMRTPLEQFGDDLGDLQEAWALGIIDDDTFDALQRNLEETLDPFGEMARQAEETAQAVRDAVSQEEAFQAAKQEAYELQAAYMGIDLAAQAHLERLDELLEKGMITWDVYAHHVAEARGEVEEVSASMVQLEDLGRQSLETLGGHVVDYFVNPFESSIEDMVASFSQAMARMALEAGVQMAINAALGGGGGLGGAIAGAAFATGGYVSGPGTATSDSINARLSDGEFVQPTASVNHYGRGFMEAVRQRKLPRFASGGMFGSGGTGGGAGGSIKIVNVSDREEAALEAQRSPAGERVFFNFIENNASEIKALLE